MTKVMKRTGQVLGVMVGVGCVGMFLAMIFGGEVFMDTLMYLPEIIRGYHERPATVYPPLTTEERGRVGEIALNDPRVQALLQDKSYATSVIGSWCLDREDPRGAKLGGILTVYFSEQHQLVGDWPYEAQYGRHCRLEKSAGTRHCEAEANGLRVKVNLEEDNVVAIWAANITFWGMWTDGFPWWPGTPWPPELVANTGDRYTVWYAGEPLGQAPWPELSEAEKARALEILLADSRVQQLLQGGEYVIEDIWPMSEPTGEVVPAEPFAEAEVRVTVEGVYLEEYDFPWPPDNMPRIRTFSEEQAALDRRWFHYSNFSPHSISVAVSLKEERVTGVLPRWGVRPRWYYMYPEGPIPTLTPGEKASVREIALSDPRVQELVGGQPYAIGPVRPYHKGAEKLGGCITIYFDDFHHMAYHWPYDDEDGQQAGTWYLETEANRIGVEANALSVKVNLIEGKVVAMKPEYLSWKVTGADDPWPAPEAG